MKLSFEIYSREFNKTILGNKKKMFAKIYNEDTKQFSEFSVLNGLHSLSFEEGLDQIRKKTPPYSPPVAFCLEFLLSKETNKTIENDVKIQSIVIDKDDMTSSLNDVVKVKIGRKKQVEEQVMINKLIQQGKTLRLDGNQFFTKDKLIKFLEGISHLNSIEYIEEPFANTFEIKNWEKTLPPLALDESFYKFQKIDSSFSYYILKPTLFGYNKTIELIHKINKLGHTSIISSTFEDELGISILKKLANIQDSYKKVFHGLDTLKYFN